jgi:hypothetical protein
VDVRCIGRRGWNGDSDAGEKGSGGGRTGGVSVAGESAARAGRVNWRFLLLFQPCIYSVFSMIKFHSAILLCCFFTVPACIFVLNFVLLPFCVRVFCISIPVFCLH